MTGYQYLEKPSESKDIVVMCPEELDLSSDFVSASLSSYSIPCWLSPYESIPAYGAVDYDRSTGIAVSEIQVASLKQLFYIITTDIVISAGTFYINWGDARLATTEHFYQHHFEELSDGSRGDIIKIDPGGFTGTDVIYNTRYGVTIMPQMTAGASGTGKIRAGFILTRKML